MKGGYGGVPVSSASGVPFYGQQNKPTFGAGAGVYGGQPAGGGGFTYGMASKGGSLFGQASAAGGSAVFSGGSQFGQPSQ